MMDEGWSGIPLGWRPELGLPAGTDARNGREPNRHV